MSRTNTALERFAIESGINLSDAHARAPLGPHGAPVITTLPLLFEQSHRMSQDAADRKLIVSFERLAGISFPRRPELSYSVSSLVAIIGNYMRREKRKVYMLDPCFDNIRDLVITAGIPVKAISEEEVERVVANFHKFKRGDVLWLTSPSNPTGWTLGRKAYAGIANACAGKGVLLVIDHCFRFFSRTTRAFNQYEILEHSSGLQYIVLEDTGKTTSLLDMKIGMMVTSHDLAEPFHLLNEELLLNVSPFVCLVVARSLDALADGDMDDYLYPLLRDNRRRIVGIFSELFPSFEIWKRQDVPLIWIDTKRSNGGEAFASQVRSRGLHILPGTRFFEKSREGRQFFRVALMRETGAIKAAEIVLRGAKDSLGELFTT